MTDDHIRLRGNLYLIAGMLLGGGLMLGTLAAWWPTECTVRLGDKFGVVHEQTVPCGY